MMKSLLEQQYDLIQKTRQSLFQFLDSIPLHQLRTELSNFGHGSIVRTHIHVADCYMYWLGAFTRLRTEPPFVPEEEIARADLGAVRDRFARADELVHDFVRTFDGRWTEPVSNHVRWQAEPFTTTPLWLLTHTITHEFHHKGQIVTMARHLGHIPPDTDLVG